MEPRQPRVCVHACHIGAALFSTWCELSEGIGMASMAHQKYPPGHETIPRTIDNMNKSRFSRKRSSRGCVCVRAVEGKDAQAGWHIGLVLGNVCPFV